MLAVKNGKPLLYAYFFGIIEHKTTLRQRNLYASQMIDLGYTVNLTWIKNEMNNLLLIDCISQIPKNLDHQGPK